MSKVLAGFWGGDDETMGEALGFADEIEDEDGDGDVDEERD